MKRNQKKKTSFDRMSLGKCFIPKRAASKIGLKINMDKTKITELPREEGDTETDTGSLAFERVNEFRYLGAILGKNNDWAIER